MAKKKPPETFEQALESLQEVVRKLEGGELGLAQSLDAYEQGIGHLKACHKHLEAAERRVEKLCGFDADGNPILEPLDEEASAEKPTKKRAKKKPTTEDEDGLF